MRHLRYTAKYYHEIDSMLHGVVSDIEKITSFSVVKDINPYDLVLQINENMGSLREDLAYIGSKE